MLEGQVAVVTGGSRGIGRAITSALHAEGMSVAVIARSVERLRALEEEFGGPGRLLALEADVSVPGQVAEAVAAVEYGLGPVDLLVNNAGVTETAETSLWEADAEEWWEVLTTNLRGPMLFCQAMVPGMRARGRGRIININSMRGVWPLPTQTAYGISKSALIKLTQSLARGLDGSGVLAFDYSPGRVNTDMWRYLGGGATIPDSSWTPMSKVVEGLVAIAQGRLDELAGRFLRATDDLAELRSRAAEVIERDGRVLAISEAFPGDPLTQRRVGGP